MNQRLAFDAVKSLMEAGVQEFCICAGARNSPLVDLLLQIPHARKFHHFEERSAAFFALGRMKSTGHPVAVITTSGTAAGELLPATMEACYSALPLVLVTADRPRRFRGSGAPQAAEQVGIFGVYAEATIDLDQRDTVNLVSWSRSKPLHLNLCFEEPLLDQSAQTELESFIRSGPTLPTLPRPSRVEDIRNDELSGFLASSRRPLVIVGALHPADREEVRRFLSAFQAPTYFEAHSGLREEPSLSKFRLHCSDGILDRARAAGYEVDGVLRIGGVPTLRLWRDLEILEGKIPVCSISREPFSGLSWARIQAVPPESALRGIEPSPIRGTDRLFSADQAIQDSVRALFYREPRSEPSLFHTLSRAIPRGARVYLGNSLPIREWDLAATFAARDFEVGASRGLNGIDGQVSTFYGFSAPRVENWAVLGDLTSLYDLPGPWILPQLPREVVTSLVVVNNKGGKIFSRMFRPSEFQNPHELDFAAWAKLWKLSYEAWDAIPDQGIETRSHRIIELLPDADATARFWTAYDSLWKSAK